MQKFLDQEVLLKPLERLAFTFIGAVCGFILGHLAATIF